MLRSPAWRWRLCRGLARIALVGLALVGTPLTGALAGVPEPDVVYYGTVKLNGVLQGAASGTSLELQAPGQTRSVGFVTTFLDGGQRDVYVARIGLESTQGTAPGCAGLCLALGSRASLFVLNAALPGGRREVARLDLGGRGRIIRQDLSVSTTNPADDGDLDDDGVPDIRDNCIKLGVSAAQTDSDGDGIGDACEASDQPGLSFRMVRDGDNPADPRTGKGAVAEAFEITSTEVTNADYVEFLNAVAAADSNGLYNETMAVDPRGGIVRAGEFGSYAYQVKPRMATKPVNFVSWLDAARYTNWLENGKPKAPQGPLTTEMGAFDLTIPTPEVDAVPRANARFSLPTEDEWYKSAYYDPTRGGSNYWLYPTGAPLGDVAPTKATANAIGDVANPGGNVVNYAANADWNGLDGNTTSAGTATADSYYGALDLGGNVDEWMANAAEATPEGLKRVARGGGFASAAALLAATAGATSRDDVLRDPQLEDAGTGFRVVRLAAAQPSDGDGDGVPDDQDNCPYAANPDQADVGGVGSGSAPDGVGDACQCGDVNDDGVVTGLDGTYAKRAALGLAPYTGGVTTLPGYAKCDVDGDGVCGGLDGTLIKRASLGLPPGVTQTCEANLPTH